MGICVITHIKTTAFEYLGQSFSIIVLIIILMFLDNLFISALGGFLFLSKFCLGSRAFSLQPFGNQFFQLGERCIELGSGGVFVVFRIRRRLCIRELRIVKFYALLKKLLEKRIFLCTVKWRFHFMRVASYASSQWEVHISVLDSPRSSVSSAINSSRRLRRCCKIFAFFFASEEQMMSSIIMTAKSFEDCKIRII